MQSRKQPKYLIGHTTTCTTNTHAKQSMHTLTQRGSIHSFIQRRYSCERKKKGKKGISKRSVYSKRHPFSPLPVHFSVTPVNRYTTGANTARAKGQVNQTGRHHMCTSNRPKDKLMTNNVLTLTSTHSIVQSIPPTAEIEQHIFHTPTQNSKNLRCVSYAHPMHNSEENPLRYGRPGRLLTPGFAIQLLLNKHKHMSKQSLQ